MKRILVTAVAVMALLALPGVALASSSSTCSAYNQQLCQVVGSNNNSQGPSTPGTGTGTPSAPVAASTSSLPFTGLDLGLLAAGGVVLLGAGLGIRRLSAQR
jgi:hypothetical protein